MEKLEHFRHILLFDFSTGAKAAEVARNVCAVYGDNVIGESTARKRFFRFKEDRFDISDTPRSGRSSGFDEDRLNTLIYNDIRQGAKSNWDFRISDQVKNSDGTDI